VYRIPRYDLKGQEILKTQEKRINNEIAIGVKEVGAGA
jgi:hypothetical protein